MDDREERTWVEGTEKAHTSNFYVSPSQPFLSDSFPFSITCEPMRPASSKGLWRMVVSIMR
jgi:hypothetical protein